MEDLYRTLQVDPMADPEIVEAAWRRLARIYHPDGERPDPERMKAINAAHDILKDPVRRAAYDRQRGTTRRGDDGRDTRGSTTGPTGWGPQPAVVRCWRHPAPAVAVCVGCRANLCASCASHWQGPYCDLCVRREGSRLQLQVLWPAVALAAWFSCVYTAVTVVTELGYYWPSAASPLAPGFYLGPGLVGLVDLSWLLIHNRYARPFLRGLLAASPVMLLLLCPISLFAGAVMVIVRGVLAAVAFPRGRRLRQQADRFLAR